MLPLQLLRFPHKVLIAGAVLFVSLMLSGVFLYEVYAQPLPKGHSVSAAVAAPTGTVYLSVAGQASAQAAVAVKEPMREVHIANNGLILLRGARVLSISGNTIHVGMTLGGSDFTWAAQTKYNSTFLNSQGKKGTLADIAVGDFVTLTGTLVGGGTEPAIDTDFVRE